MSGSASTTNTVEFFGAAGISLRDSGQGNVNLHPARYGIVGPNPSVVRLDNGTANRQSDSQPVGLVRRERHEQEVRIELKPWAAVVYGNQHGRFNHLRVNVDAPLVAR